jgi:hypothetical protein
MMHPHADMQISDCHRVTYFVEQISFRVLLLYVVSVQFRGRQSHGNRVPFSFEIRWAVHEA